MLFPCLFQGVTQISLQNSLPELFSKPYLLVLSAFLLSSPTLLVLVVFLLTHLSLSCSSVCAALYQKQCKP